MTKGWEVKSIPWEENSLTDMVRTQAYITSKLKDGYKIKDNVIEVYFLALDFDKGVPTLEDLRELAKEFQFSSFIHTTISHQKVKYEKNEMIEPRDRCRVIIPFARPISISELYEIKKVIVKRFPTVDPTCLDGNRYFMVNPDAICSIHNYYGSDPFESAKIPVFLNPDDILKKEKREKVSNWNTADDEDEDLKTHGKKKKEKNKAFSKNDYIKLHDGTERQIKQITQKEKIFCPFCIHDHAHRSNPDNANAFIDFNNAGSLFIYCSSEGKTYWQEHTDVNEKKCKLFWNTSVGVPSMIDYEATEDEEDKSVYYVFKNDADFRNYCCQNQINPSVRDYLPRRAILFNPGLPSGLTEKYYNLFVESEYMKKDYSNYPKLHLDSVAALLDERAPVISEILNNVLGTPVYVTRFINWIAYILQERKKANTA